MKLSIRKWGNSASVRLPADLLKQIGAHIGMELDATVTSDGLMLKPMHKHYTLDELLVGMTEENRHEEIQWGSDVGREIV